MTTHPLSTFAIDVWFAEGKPAGEVSAHVAGCTSCAAYVAELDTTLEAPARRRFPIRVVVPAVAALALAASIAFVLRSPRGDDDYVGVKGAPAVQVLVRSGGETKIWDGRSPVHAGDALAIHVACEHLAHVTVVTEDASGIVRLSDSSCASSPSTLPFTLVVDDRPGRERFSVVLTKVRLDDAKIRPLVQAQSRDRDAWVMAFDFPKEPRR